MGLKLRLNLFYGVEAKDVYSAYARFYAERGQPLQDAGDEHFKFDLYEQDNNWTALWLDGGWEQEIRREARLFASKMLACPGFYIFVYDGDYWGYELFDEGEGLDHFLQIDNEETNHWFPGKSVKGDAVLIASLFPHLKAKEVALYLVQEPPFEEFNPNWTQKEISAYRKRVFNAKEQLNVLVRPDDEFKRFEECAVLDFLRLLGIRVELRERVVSEHGYTGGFVTLLAPEYRSFWVKYRQFWSDDRKT